VTDGSHGEKEIDREADRGEADVGEEVDGS
jgi:hypothetical protein